MLMMQILEVRHFLVVCGRNKSLVCIPINEFFISIVKSYQLEYDYIQNCLSVLEQNCIQFDA